MTTDSSAEQALAVLLGLSQEILGIPRLEPTDHFLKCGGSSVQLLRLVTRMEHEHDLHVDIRYLIEAPSFADLADRCTFGGNQPPAGPAGKTSSI
jgi:aryl carrier-like protein